MPITLSHEVDESRDHEDGVEVELEIGVVLPGEGLPLGVGAVLDDPVEAEGHDAVEQDLRDQDEEAEAAARPRRHAVVLVLPVSGDKGREKGNAIRQSSTSISVRAECIMNEAILTSLDLERIFDEDSALSLLTTHEEGKREQLNQTDAVRS